MPAFGWFLLGTLVWVGHGVILTWTHNFFYGRVHSRRLADFFQLVHGALLLTPPFFWKATSPGFPQFEFAGFWDWFTLAHGFVSLLALPTLFFITLARQSRTQPRGLNLVGKRLFEPEKETGKRLGGAGFRNWLCHLPFNETLRPEIVEYVLEVDNLPSAWEGLRILHLSDLHFHGSPERDWYRAVLEQCSEPPPDLLVCSGDFVDGEEFHQWLSGTIGRLKWQECALAVLGNHDTWYDPVSLRKTLKRMGFQILSNCWRVVEIRGFPMLVAGIESPWVHGMPQLEGAPSGLFRLLVSHTPDHLGWAAKNNFDLMFAGHVHGGQICLPGIGPLVMPSKKGRTLDRGWFQKGKTRLYVSKGMGGTHPIRWNCRPEAMILTLRSTHQKAKVGEGK